MKNRSFKYILSVMLTSVFLMTGCGSSSNNPVSSGNVSNGLVNISGTVNNLSGNGRVSFCTPAAAARNGMNTTNPFRASISNEGVYTFNTDENSNYSGQIPAGDYYVIAENSDGTMKSVSTLQRFSVAAETGNTHNITLLKTINISGKLSSDFNKITMEGLNNNNLTEEPIASIAVYIEKMPFIAITDSNGNYKFNSVPVLTDNNKYTIKSTFNVESFVLTASKELTKDDLGDGSLDITDVNLTFTSEELLTNLKAIQGFVYSDENQTPKSKQLVVALLGSGQILSTVTDNTGLFIFLINKNESSAQLSVNMVDYNNAEITSIGSTEFNNTFILSTGSTSVKSGILIKEEIDSDEDMLDGFYFSKYGEATLTLFKRDQSIEKYYSEKVYMPLASYTISNLENGTYCYMLATHDYKHNNFGFRFSDDIIVNDSLQKASSQYYAMFNAPTIKISENDYVVSSDAISETNFGTSVTIATFAYAINQSTPGSEIPLTIAATTNIIGINELDSGYYDIYAGYSINYNSCSVATITSDPYPYAKQ